jgi:hypothetical protein
MKSTKQLAPAGYRNEGGTVTNGTKLSSDFSAALSGLYVHCPPTPGSLRSPGATLWRPSGTQMPPSHYVCCAALEGQQENSRGQAKRRPRIVQARTEP